SQPPLTYWGGVRLANGDNKCSGRVEVLRHDQWGTVCDHGWDMREANVVCLELGCGLAESATLGAAFGAGRGEIWLRHVQCTGHESSLTRCGVILHNNSYCSHENDAGVKCSVLTSPAPPRSMPRAPTRATTTACIVSSWVDAPLSPEKASPCQ
uniref:SRCR domain-containing protein n=1 Tax=Mola mola TaxID=94237 RepID=A0A3Q3W535_MOLML